MRQLWISMRICIDLPLPNVECKTLYLMPLDLNLFLEFHRSECQLYLHLQRVSVFQGHSMAAAGFQKTGSNL
jgi:hypothetical protein